MIDPLPPQLVHGSEKANDPWLRVTRPEPWHTGQSRGDVPGLAPIPWQVGQVARSATRTGTVTPRTASVKPKVISVSTSAPRRARGARAPAPRLNKPPKRSENPPPPAA